jgi:hypothetical protein
MKKLLVCTFGLMSSLVLAETPQPRVDYASAYNGYATITGGLEQTPSAPVGVVVQMSGFRYSTITDANGKWGIVVKYTSSSYSVNSFSLTNATDHSSITENSLK